MTHDDFSSWPMFTEEEVAVVKEVLLSSQVNYWTGHQCREFENEFAEYIGVKHAIALANGTVALDLAFKALDIGGDDEVIVTSRTFLASVSSIVNAGATPVFADVNSESQNLSKETIESLITHRTRAIVCVHLAGWPCDMDPIMEIADQKGLFVIEDCAQAHGARYKGSSVGSIGHVGAWSFCQDKIMSTGGEGGMVTTDDQDLWRKMWAYKDHGKSYAAVYEHDHPPGFRWLHESFGTNFRMTEMQAAIGRIQVKRMPEWTRLRNRNAHILSTEFAAFEGENKLLRIPRIECSSCLQQSEAVCQQGCVHAYYKFYVFVQPSSLANGWSRDRVVAEINAAGVPCMQGSCSEVYLERAFDETDFRPVERLPVARLLGETSLMFLVHPTLSKEEIHKVAQAAGSIFEKAQR